MPEHVESSPFTKSFWVLLLEFIGYACRLAVTVILTRHLSLELYGDFAVAWRSLIFVSMLLTYGTAASARRFVTDYVAAHDQRRKRSFTYWVFQLLARSTVRLFVVYITFWMMTNVLHVIDISWLEKYHLAVFTLVLAPALSVFAILASYILSHGYGLLTAFLNSVVFYGVQFLVVTIFFAVFIPENITHLSALLFSIVLVLMAVGAMISLSVPNMGIVQSVVSKPRRYVVDEAWMDVSQVAYLNELLVNTTLTMNLYILELFAAQESNVGIYSVCETWIVILGLLFVSLSEQGVQNIHEVGHASRSKYRRLQRSLDFFNSSKLLMAFVFLGFTWAFRVSILSFFSIPQGRAEYLLPLMIFNAYLGDNQYQLSYLMAHDDWDWVQRVQLLAVLLLVVVSCTLVFPFGMFGVAFATTLSRLVCKGLFTYRCRQRTSLRLNLLV